MNGVGCTLYEMFDKKGKHKESRTSVQLQIPTSGKHLTLKREENEKI